MAQNRGTGWHSLNVKIMSAEQLLMAIEYASFNAQTSVGSGITSYQIGTSNMAAFTGSTYSLGNGSGSAASTLRLQNNGTLNTYTSSGYVSVKYRGVENHWGDMWIFINGINIWGDNTMLGGEPYICDDFSYDPEKNTGNYKPVGYTLPLTQHDGYVSRFGYDEQYDWVLIPTKNGGNSSLPIGDGMYAIQRNNYKDITLGGRWSNGQYCGMYDWSTTNPMNDHQRYEGARLIKV
jgi:hypothetical protein